VLLAVQTAAACHTCILSSKCASKEERRRRGTADFDTRTAEKRKLPWRRNGAFAPWAKDSDWGDELVGGGLEMGNGWKCGFCTNEMESEALGGRCIGDGLKRIRDMKDL
jgi:hypothetical protein